VLDRLWILHSDSRTLLNRWLELIRQSDNTTLVGMASGWMLQPHSTIRSGMYWRRRSDTSCLQDTGRALKQEEHNTSQQDRRLVLMSL